MIPVNLSTGRQRLSGAIFDALLGLLFPSYCLGCGLRIQQQQEPLCPPCIFTLDRADEREVNTRIQILQAAEIIDKAFSLWLYTKDGVLQHVQHNLKYGNRPWYGPPLGRQIGTRLQAEYLGYAPDIIIPVPLHRSRFLERGYNQSAMLANGMRDIFQIPVREDLLMRTRATKSQTRLSRQARWTNVAGAFKAPQPDELIGKNILLIDDLLTTGATAVSAATALKEAGTAHICLATLGFAELMARGHS